MKSHNTVSLRLLFVTGMLCFMVGMQVGTVRDVAITTTTAVKSSEASNTTSTTFADKSVVGVDLPTKQDVARPKPKQKPTHSKQVLPAKLNFYDERLILTPTPLEKQQITKMEYPFLPRRIIRDCGLDKFQDQHQRNQRLALTPLNHSIAYIKPHKTGSSTITALLNRILYGRGAIKMIPSDRTYLGWKVYNKEEKEFPGKVDGLEKVMNHSKYDAFCNHAVWTNRTRVQHFLKDPVFVTTILRQPVARTISAFNFFPMGNSWSAFLKQYEKTAKISDWKEAMGRNNLAYALGWYSQPHIDFSTRMDRNETLIRQFIEKVDAEMDLVMILERLPESLVLLKEEGLTKLDVRELVWSDFSGDKPIAKEQQEEQPKKQYPNGAQTARLSKMLHLDQAIYNHFRDKFDRRWEAAVARKPELVGMRDALKCSHERLRKSFGDKILPRITEKAYKLLGADWTQILLSRQKRRQNKLQ